MTKQLYAEEYDKQADRLYHFALYLLGDTFEARSALAAAFSEGWFTLRDDTAPYFQHMLRTVWECSLQGSAAKGQRYVQTLCSAIRCTGDDAQMRLFETLGQMDVRERAILLLTFLFGLTQGQTAWILGSPPSDIAQALKGLCRTVSQRVPA